MPFEGEATVDGVAIHVEADAGAFPAGATLSVKKVPTYKKKLVDDAIDEVREADRQVAVSYVFDIKVLDADGVEIQPAEGYSVRVSFALSEVADANLDTDIYHVTGEGADLSAEPLEALESGETVMADTDGFSYYTVEFTYETKQYVLDGGESVPLRDILLYVGLDGVVTDVEVSNSALFSASNANGAWVVESHAPFSSEEWMRVTIDGVKFEIVVTDDDITAWAQLQTELSKGGKVTLQSDVTYTDDDTIGALIVRSGTVTLDLNGHTINRGLSGKAAEENGNVITVDGSGNLTIMDSEGTGTITGGSNQKGGGVYIITVGQLTLQSGTISGNTSSSGGGVYIGSSSASFTMKGGTISGNIAEHGGGVYIKDGTFSMPNEGTSGGTISNNEATVGDGGGVYVNNGTFTMSAGTISGNKATSSCGGGVFVSGYNTEFTMNGGTISGNTASKNGGGVYLGYSQYKTKQSVFTMSAGTINKNKATTGGGVYVKDGTFTMSAGTIGGSSADDKNSAQNGGGVYVYYSDNTSDYGLGKFKLEGGNISSNNANSSGGGVYVGIDSSRAGAATYEGFTMSGGNITSNTAQSGAGVFHGGGIFTMSGGTIGGTNGSNIATSNGGGVYVNTASSAFNVSGSPTIYNNELQDDTANNVYLPFAKGTIQASKTITISGDLTGTERIGVTMEQPGTFTSGLNGHGEISYFSSDNEDYGVFKDENSEAKLALVYTINYDLKNGAWVGDAPTNKFATDSNVTLPTNVQKDGYEFGGWYENDSYTGENVTTYSNIKANKTVYAKWIKDLTDATVTVDDLTYNGVVLTPSIEIKDGETTLTAGTDYTLSYSPGEIKNAGEYTANVTFTGLYKGETSTKFTVKQKEVTVTAKAQTVDLNGSITNSVEQVENTALATGHGLSAITLTSADSTEHAKVFPNSIVPSGAQIKDGSNNDVTSNYKITYEKGTLTVNKGTASVATPPVGATDLTYTGESLTLISTAGTPSGGEMQYKLSTQDDSAYSDSFPTATDAGDYTVNYRVQGDDDHENSEAGSITVTIQKAEPTAILFDFTPPSPLVYNGTAKAATVTVKSEYSSMVGSVTLQYSADGGESWTATPKDVGTYKVGVVVDNTGKNYSAGTITDSAWEFEITPATLTIKAEAKTKTYGEEDPALEYTSEGLVDGDSISGGLKRESGNDVGTYKILNDGLTAGPNYTIKYTGADFTITPKEVTNPTVAVASGGVYDGKEKTPTVTVMDGDKEIPAEEYTVSYTDNVNAGTDTAKVTITDNADGNYTFNEVSATFTISPRPATVTANSQSVPLNGSIDTAVGQVTLSGGASGHTVGAVKLTADSTDKPGSFPGAIVIERDSVKIMAGTEDVTGNYEITYKDGDLTVNKLDVSVTAPKAVTGLVYDGTARALVAAGETSGGTMQYSLSKDGPFTDALPTGANAGSYGVYYRVKGDELYNDSAVLGPVAVSIAKKTVTVTADDATKPYGANDPELTYAVAGLLGSDKLSGALTRAAGEDPGKYAIGQGTLSAGDNYDLDFTGATLTILEPPKPEPNFTLLATMMSASGTKSLDLTWTRVTAADGYDIFFSRCTGKSAYKLLASVNGSDNCDYTIKKLISGVDYKAYVKAWRTVDGVKRYIGEASPTVHAICGRSSKKLCDAGRISLNKSSFTLSPGSAATVRGSVKGSKYGRKVLRHAKTLRFFTSDARIATVSASGVITAVSDGSCEIYVMANNGIYRTVKVTVDSETVGVSFKKGSKTVKVGRKLNLGKRVVLVPPTIQAKLTWTSSKPKVATVSETGVVKARSKGKTVITVQTENGKTASITITVK